MLIRIVRMHFKESCIKDFLELFNTHKVAIRNFKGCRHLALLKDLENPAIYTTLSHWEDEASLENYRSSLLFASIWKQTKPLFAERTQAFSLEKYIEL
jgi:heme oxygenase (mycobilin-producing)